MTLKTVVCHQCKTGTNFDRKIMRNDFCPSCRGPLKCCLNCSFYSEHAHNKCLEPTAEWVSDRKAANFCEHFEPAGEKKGKGDDSARKSRDAFNALFSKKPPPV